MKQKGMRSYVCGGCSEEITPERLVAVAPSQTRQGMVVLTFVCPCTPGKRLHGEYTFSGTILTGLIGKMRLPWRSELSPEVISEDDPRLRYWRWELEQIADGEEFQWWLDHS